VLIVDDQEDIRLMLRILLENQGWDTEQSPSGEDALAQGDRVSRFDAVVVDYKMPGLDGIEVARRFRGAGFNRPIIICSAYLTTEIERAASRLRAEAVTKSDLDALVETVRREVQG
jgi:CheY-like chemotaxis protein